MLKKIKSILKKIYLEHVQPTQAYHDFLGFLGRIKSEDEFRQIPDHIIVEPTNACNLRCPVCPTHFAMKRARGNMDIDLFKRLIDEFSGKAVKPSITLHMAGEPLMSRQLPDFVQYANEHGHRTLVSTNATLLDESYSTALIESGLSVIYLCIDGATKDSHEAYRVGSSFEQVKENIETFCRLRNERDGRTPFISIQSLLTSFSEKETEELTQWAREIGADEISFKSLSLGSYTSKAMKEEYAYLEPTRKEYRRKQSELAIRTCSSILNHALVYWNGDIGLCCVDFDKAVPLPNIKEKGFIKTFTSPEVVKARKAGFLKHHPLCKRCSAGSRDYDGFKVAFNQDSRG